MSSPPIPMPKMIWQVLQARQIQSLPEIQQVFSPQLKELSNPYSLDQMDLAVDRLSRAYQKGEKICLYADFDLDGTSGLALLKRGLELLGFENLVHYQPSRLSEGYGLHSRVLEKLKAQGVHVVVTIDVGITALEAALRAQELGLDLIVTDHHLPKESLPEALALVNPNKGTCGSGLGHLCGAGVAFYLFLALKMRFQKEGWLRSEVNSKELLDCFAIGTLTDMVPLRAENRVLVKHGLVELAKTRRPGLKSLLKALNLWGRPLSAQDVAIRFAPKLNALSRMERGILPLDLFLIESEEQAQALVDQVIQNNADRVAFQAAAESLAEERAQDLLMSSSPSCLFVWDESFHPGVVGLVATRLAQKFSLPSFVGALRDGMIVGSARGTGQEPGVLLGLESSSQFLERFGGHAQAAGFELDPAKAEGFAGALEEYYQSIAQAGKGSSEVTYFDASGRLAEITPSFMRWYEGLGPFGAQFELPLFHLEELEIRSLRELRGGHIKLELADRNFSQVRKEALWFSPPPSHPLLRSQGLEPGRTLEVLAHPQWNYFNGSQSLQLVLEDLR